MREWCGCGAGLKAARRDVLTWRTGHRCNITPVVIEAESATEEQTPADDLGDDVATVGFTLNRKA